MNDPKFSVKQCSNNPRRWYVSFKPKEKFHLSLVEQALIKKQFNVLINTPTVMVFKSKNLRLTWHCRGLIQVDLYELDIETSKEIEQLINEIFGYMNSKK